MVIKDTYTNLTKEVKDRYSEIHRTMMKEAEEDTKEWEDLPSAQWEEYC